MRNDLSEEQKKLLEQARFNFLTEIPENPRLQFVRCCGICLKEVDGKGKNKCKCKHRHKNVVNS